jgi:hypothetical protein
MNTSKDGADQAVVVIYVDFPYRSILLSNAALSFQRGRGLVYSMRSWEKQVVSFLPLGFLFTFSLHLQAATRYYAD